MRLCPWASQHAQVGAAHVLGWGGLGRCTGPGAEVTCEPHTDQFLDMDCRRGLAHGLQPKNGTLFTTGKAIEFSARIHNTHGIYLKNRCHVQNISEISEWGENK